jgi:hypothetical protein
VRRGKHNKTSSKIVRGFQSERRKGEAEDNMTTWRLAVVFLPCYQIFAVDAAPGECTREDGPRTTYSLTMHENLRGCE